MNNRVIAASFLIGILSEFSGSTFAGPQVAAQSVEPNAERAVTWWEPQRHVMTPIGWKDHLFRFNILYNGTVIARTNTAKRNKKHTQPYEQDSFQLIITPSVDGKLPESPPTEPYPLFSLSDKGVGRQGWVNCPTPVLWTEWPMSEQGMVLREEVFARIPGSDAVETGIEPLYAWIRLSVDGIDPLLADKQVHFLIRLGRPHYHHLVRYELLLMAHPSELPYPSKLREETFDDGRRYSTRIIQEDGRVRFMGLADKENTFAFIEREPDSKDYYLQVTLPACKGAHADLLFPMIPGSRQEVDAESSIGFDEALRQCHAYWSAKPETAACIDTPEPQINEAIAWSLKFGELLTERNPNNGEFSLITSSWQYDALWPTPTSMVSSMIFDPLGYHAVVEKHIEIFRKNQGTIKPPGKSYPLHPGYFSSPKTLTSVDWLSDHGAILHQVSRHALLAGDQGFVDRWLDAIVKGCEFIKDARAIEGHEGTPGILPPAVATDREIPNQSVWNIGWNYKGLCTAVRLLEQIGHPRAEEFAREAQDYRTAFIRILCERAGEMPRWTDDRGGSHPIVPLSLTRGGDDMKDVAHDFYLDTGPLFLVWSGLLDADDELMQASLAFFREGPNTKIFDSRYTWQQRPILVHEISSAEVGYSWNIYHSWQLGDRYHYLEALYSMLAGGMSRQTYISCERRHGIFGHVFTSVLLLDLIRLAVVDDQISEGDLHLLRMVPKAWLKSDYLTRFEKIATEFGTVTLRFKLTDNGKTLDVSYETNYRHRPEKVLLHIPPLEQLETVLLNGKLIAVQPGQAIVIK